MLKLTTPKKRFVRNIVLFSSCFVAMQGLVTANAADNLEGIYKEGKIFGQIRSRYEHVDQTGIAKNADAYTTRANLGIETGEFNGFKAAFEVQTIQHMGEENFNDTVNGKTNRPVIADADDTAINQAWVSWAGHDAEIKVGRQGLNLDNQRFIGTVGWRQNDQAYDSVFASYKGIENLNVEYGYAWNIKRVFGNDNPAGDVDSATHIARVGYKFSDWLNATAYGLLIDLETLPGSSSQTYGLRTTGKVAIDDVWTFSYQAEAATQSDYANNTANYSQEYYHVAPAISAHGVTLQAGYEVLGGDGTSAFQTPLATAHAHNGWADKFLSTPANGLEDAYVKLSYKVADMAKWVDGTTFTAVYHDYEGQETGNFGTEWNFAIAKSYSLPSWQPFKKINLLAKYADYNAKDAPFTDTKKAWVQVGVNF